MNMFLDVFCVNIIHSGQLFEALLVVVSSKIFPFSLDLAASFPFLSASLQCYFCDISSDGNFCGNSKSFLLETICQFLIFSS